MGLVLYNYAFSLIGVSPFVYVITRYLADRYFEKNFSAFAPSYLTIIALIFTLQSIVAYYFLSAQPLVLGLKIILWVLYLFSSGIWIAMLYLSAAKSFFGIIWSFLAGGAIGIALSFLLGRSLGLIGFMLGFTLGQGICFGLLTFRILREFGLKTFYDFRFFPYFRKHPYLIFIGLFYYGALWVDKMVFWFSPVGEPILGWVRFFPSYDTPIFLGFLTVVPSMAFFLVQMETSFVRVYERYYEGIRRRAPYREIEENRLNILENLTQSFKKYILFQGIISGLVLLFIYQIADVFFLNPAQMGIFRIGILASFMQMGFLMVLNVIFYFDFQKEAFLMTYCFFITNFLFTLASLKIGFQSFGFGFAAASFISVVYAFLILNEKLKELNYWTFMKQPIFIPKFKLEKEG